MNRGNSTDISFAAGLLQDGKLVAIPTETVYGLAANALNADAVLNIFEAKNRPHFDPLIVHVGSINQAQHLTRYISSEAQKLMEAFWPGPLTIVLAKKDMIPHIVTSGMDTVGLDRKSVV
jgi:L-threonylcarbamoyladenylate synthase